MKVTIKIPTDYAGTSVHDSIEEIDITLPVNATLEDMLLVFRTILYAQTYHPQTIGDHIPSEDGL